MMNKAAWWQLLEYAKEWEESGAYWGAKEQFWERHAKIVAFLESQVEAAK